MLKKLYKHEFYSLYRNLLPVYVALIGLAIINRISFLADSNGNIYLEGWQESLIIFYVLGIMALFMVGFVIVITRFYKHLLSKEGYLTFTLPITPTSHITCKLVCGIIVTITNCVVTLISLLILALGTNAMSEILDGLEEVWAEIIKTVSPLNITIFAVEIILIILLTMCQGLLMFYTSMAIGQQFKNRIAGAVVAYICIYAALQMIGIVGITPIAILNTDKINAFFESNPISSGQLMFGVIIVGELILSAVYFFITNFMLTKKLNLE
ncbi:MAG: hypothetical protein ACOYJS_02270 [Acutalibacteraceae bacterium]|jgi:hypothetical protein